MIKCAGERKVVAFGRGSSCIGLSASGCSGAQQQGMAPSARFKTMTFAAGSPFLAQLHALSTSIEACRQLCEHGPR